MCVSGIEKGGAVRMAAGSPSCLYLCQSKDLGNAVTEGSGGQGEWTRQPICSHIAASVISHKTNIFSSSSVVSHSFSYSLFNNSKIICELIYRNFIN